jgi:hypothetical protein
VIYTFDDDELFRLGHLREERFDIVARAEFIVAALDNELRLGAFEQVFEIGFVDWDAEADQFFDSSIFASDAKADPGAKTEPGQDYGAAGEVGGKKIYGGLHVAAFAEAAGVFAFAQARTAEVKSEDRRSTAVKSLSNLIDNFIVHGAREEWVRVADHGGEWRFVQRARPEQSFELSGGAIEEKRAMKNVGHNSE